MERLKIDNVQDTKHWLVSQAVRLSKHTEEIVNITNVKNLGDVHIELLINGKECPFLDLIESFEQEVFKNAQKKLLSQFNLISELKAELSNTIDKMDMKLKIEVDKLFTERRHTISPFQSSKYKGEALFDLEKMVLDLLKEGKGRSYVIESLNNSATPSLNGKRWELQMLNYFMTNKLHLTKEEIRNFKYPAKTINKLPKLKKKRIKKEIPYTPEKLAEVKTTVASLLKGNKGLDYVLYMLNDQKIYTSAGDLWTKPLLRAFISNNLGADR